MASLCTAPAAGLTDRAKRYRAQNCIEQKEKICIFCGHRRDLDVHHVNGKESDGAPENLAYACRPCNTQAGVVMKKAGIGTRTAQYNPKPHGARSLGQWVMAVLAMKGQGSMDPAAAVEIIRATSPRKRAEFAREIWERRREHGTDKTAVPF